MQQSQIIQLLTILVLAFFQNISFSIVSRSRNRNNMTYHMIAAVGSNVIWFLTFRQLMLGEMTWILLPGYTIGTVAGSILGVRISMYIERLLDAKSDDHLVIPGTVTAKNFVIDPGNQEMVTRFVRRDDGKIVKTF